MSSVARGLRYPLGLAVVLGVVAAAAWPALRSARRSAGRAAIR